MYSTYIILEHLSCSYDEPFEQCVRYGCGVTVPLLWWLSLLPLPTISRILTRPRVRNLSLTTSCRPLIYLEMSQRRDS